MKKGQLIAEKPKIEHGLLLPPRGRWLESNMLKLREAMLSMNIGDSFIWHEHSSPFRVAKELEIEITTRKLNGEGYRIWRI